MYVLPHTHIKEDTSMIAEVDDFCLVMYVLAAVFGEKLHVLMTLAWKGSMSNWRTNSTSSAVMHTRLRDCTRLYRKLTAHTLCIAINRLKRA